MSNVRSFALVIALALSSISARAQANPEVWRRSYALEAQGDSRGALTTLETLPEDSRRSYIYTLRRAWLLYLVGRFDDSAAAYQQAAAASPNAVEPRVGGLLPLMAQRRWQDAERLARDVLRMDTGNYLASRRLALVLYNLGRFDAAKEAYEQVLARYPGDLEMLTGVGWCELRRGHRDEAAQAFRGVLAVSPDDANATAGLSASTHHHR